MITDKEAKSKAKITRYGKVLGIYLQREGIYTENKALLFAAVFGQCTTTMVAGLKSQDNFQKNELSKDVVWLLKAVLKLSIGINEHENEAVMAYDDLHQSDGESIDKFQERYEEAYKTAEAAARYNCLIPQIQRTSDKYKILSDAD